MISDKRQELLAENLVGYSIKAGKGDKVWIDIIGDCGRLPECIIRAVYRHGAMPFVNIVDKRILREVLNGTDEKQLEIWARRDMDFMDKMDCYIGVRGDVNSYELSDVPSEKMRLYDRLYLEPVHSERRVAHTRWVILRYPTTGMSQLAGMSTSAFEDYYFDVCCLDYEKMGKAMQSLVELMNSTDKVRIVAKDTDLTFSIKGIGAVKCAGGCNIPDGEVYTAPVKDSVNGYIHYNVPSIENDFKFENVRLEFKDGRIVNASANDSLKANELFDTDEGARYVGEFAIGVNPYVTKAIGDILFDERISGSIHFTPGCCYDDAPNENKSALHWDLVLCQTPEYGGGEIWFDDVLIRKDGLFVIDELKGLNPENLK